MMLVLFDGLYNIVCLC